MSNLYLRAGDVCSAGVPVGAGRQPRLRHNKFDKTENKPGVVVSFSFKALSLIFYRKKNLYRPSPENWEKFFLSFQQCCDSGSAVIRIILGSWIRIYTLKSNKSQVL
jgi:hypothetical protein